MIKEFLEKRRIYKLVKQNKSKISFLKYVNNSDTLCHNVSYAFSFRTKHKMYLSMWWMKLPYSTPHRTVVFDGCLIDGWYGWRLSRLLKKVVSKYNKYIKEKRLKELSKVGR